MAAFTVDQDKIVVRWQATHRRGTYQRCRVVDCMTLHVVGRQCISQHVVDVRGAHIFKLVAAITSIGTTESEVVRWARRVPVVMISSIESLAPCANATGDIPGATRNDSDIGIKNRYNIDRRNMIFLLKFKCPQSLQNGSPHNL